MASACSWSTTRRAHGRGFSFDHGLGDFVREFDAGRHPDLVAA